MKLKLLLTLIIFSSISCITIEDKVAKEFLKKGEPEIAWDFTMNYSKEKPYDPIALNLVYETSNSLFSLIKFDNYNGIEEVSALEKVLEKYNQKSAFYKTAQKDFKNYLNILEEKKNRVSLFKDYKILIGAKDNINNKFGEIIKKCENGIKELDAMITSSNNEAVYLFNNANNLKDAGKYKEAIEIFSESKKYNKDYDIIIDSIIEAMNIYQKIENSSPDQIETKKQVIYGYIKDPTNKQLEKKAEYYIKKHIEDGDKFLNSFYYGNSIIEYNQALLFYNKGKNQALINKIKETKGKIKDIKFGDVVFEINDVKDIYDDNEIFEDAYKKIDSSFKKSNSVFNFFLRTPNSFVISKAPKLPDGEEDSDATIATSAGDLRVSLRLAYIEPSDISLSATTKEEEFVYRRNGLQKPNPKYYENVRAVEDAKNNLNKMEAEMNKPLGTDDPVTAGIIAGGRKLNLELAKTAYHLAKQDLANTSETIYVDDVRVAKWNEVTVTKKVNAKVIVELYNNFDKIDTQQIIESYSDSAKGIAPIEYCDNVSVNYKKAKLKPYSEMVETLKVNLREKIVSEITNTINAKFPEYYSKNLKLKYYQDERKKDLTDKIYVLLYRYNSFTGRGDAFAELKNSLNGYELENIFTDQSYTNNETYDSIRKNYTNISQTFEKKVEVDKIITKTSNTGDNSSNTFKSSKSYEDEKISVTFKYKGSAESVVLVGSFNNWDVNDKTMRMKKNTYGQWMISVKLKPGKHQYKFFINGKWPNSMKELSKYIDPAPDGYKDDGYGGYNAVINAKWD